MLRIDSAVKESTDNVQVKRSSRIVSHRAYKPHFRIKQEGHRRSYLVDVDEDLLERGLCDGSVLYADSTSAAGVLDHAEGAR